MMLRFHPGDNCCEGVCGDPFLEPWNSIDSPPWTIGGTDIYSIVSGTLQADLPAATNITSGISRCFSVLILEDDFVLSLTTTFTFDVASDIDSELHIGRTSIRALTSTYLFNAPGSLNINLGIVPASGDEIEIRITDVGAGNCDCEAWINGVMEETRTVAITSLVATEPDDMGLRVNYLAAWPDPQQIQYEYMELTITY